MKKLNLFLINSFHGLLLGLVLVCRGLNAESVSERNQTGLASQSLLLLVRANPETHHDQIKATLRAGIKQAGCQCTEIQIREVDSTVIDQLEAALRMLEPTVDTSLARKKQSLAFRKKGVQAWEITLPAPTSFWISKFEVQYSGDDNRHTASVSYVPVVPEEARVPSLVVISVRNGLYEFYPDPQKGRPVRYRIFYAGHGYPSEMEEGEFPVVDKCYVINLHGFVGRKESLFEVVKDKDKVANPFTDIRERSNVTLVFGSIDARSATTGETIVGLDLLVSVSGVTGRSPARAWMLFPLTPQQAQEVAGRIDKLNEAPVSLPDFIRKNAADMQKSVVELAGPKWFELSPSGSGFEGRIKLAQSPEDLQLLAQKYPEMFRILVWEFEYSGSQSREAIYVEGNRLYKLEEMTNWGKIISQAIIGNQ